MLISAHNRTRSSPGPSIDSSPNSHHHQPAKHHDRLRGMKFHQRPLVDQQKDDPRHPAQHVAQQARHILRQTFTRRWRSRPLAGTERVAALHPDSRRISGQNDAPPISVPHALQNAIHGTSRRDIMRGERNKRGPFTQCITSIAQNPRFASPPPIPRRTAIKSDRLPLCLTVTASTVAAAPDPAAPSRLFAGRATRLPPNAKHSWPAASAGCSTPWTSCSIPWSWHSSSASSPWTLARRGCSIP